MNVDFKNLKSLIFLLLLKSEFSHDFSKSILRLIFIHVICIPGVLILYGDASLQIFPYKAISKYNKSKFIKQIKCRFKMQSGCFGLFDRSNKAPVLSPL